MAYERYRRGIHNYSVPAISITGRRLRLNAVATQIVADAKIEQVVILYDAANFKMALQQAAAGDEDSYSVTFGKRRSASLAAKGFFRRIGWTATKGVTLPVHWNASELMLEFKLPPEFLGGGKGKPARVRGKSKAESNG